MMHSEHSLLMKTPTKASTQAKEDAKDASVLVYLDSHPPILDSGIRRNKELQNNPMSLESDAIDPMLRDDYISLPPLRSVIIIY